MGDEACGAMLVIEDAQRRERVHVCVRDPHDRGRHNDGNGTRWETRGEHQLVTHAASR